MEQKAIFRRAAAGEVPHIFHLIRERVRWMEERGLRQWNVTGYLEAYPLPYYEEAQALGRLFVLAAEGGQSVGRCQDGPYRGILRQKNLVGQVISFTKKAVYLCLIFLYNRCGTSWKPQRERKKEYIRYAKNENRLYHWSRL